MTEHQLYGLIADYLNLQYPDVIYRFDLAADLKLTPGQARKHKRLHPRRGYPDLFIAQPQLSMGMDGLQSAWHGLFIEIKRDGTRVFKRDGSYVKDEHIREQAKMLERLRLGGYRAYFAVGFEQAKEIIDNYMGRRSAEDIF